MTSAVGRVVDWRRESAARETLLHVADDLGELGFQHGLGWQRGPVLGHDNAVLVHLQELNLLATDLRAEDQTDRSLLALPALVTVEPPQVELHLALETGVELPDLELDSDQASQRAAEEQQVQVEVIAIDGHSLLAGDEGEALADLEQERLDVAQDRGLQILLQVAVVEAEGVEDQRVSERVTWNR